MSAIKPKKLSLSTQTIRTLTSDELVGVGGGANWTRPITWVTRNVCPSVTIETATRLLGCNGNNGGTPPAPQGKQGGGQ